MFSSITIFIILSILIHNIYRYLSSRWHLAVASESNNTTKWVFSLLMTHPAEESLSYQRPLLCLSVVSWEQAYLEDWPTRHNCWKQLSPSTLPGSYTAHLFLPLLGILLFSLWIPKPLSHICFSGHRFGPSIQGHFRICRETLGLSCGQQHSEISDHRNWSQYSRWFQGL